MRLELSLANQFFTVSHSLFRSYQSGIDENNLWKCTRQSELERERNRLDRGIIWREESFGIGKGLLMRPVVDRWQLFGALCLSARFSSKTRIRTSDAADCNECCNEYIAERVFRYRRSEVSNAFLSRRPGCLGQMA